MTLIFDREYLKSLFAGDKEKRISRIEESLRRDMNIWLMDKKVIQKLEAYSPI